MTSFKKNPKGNIKQALHGPIHSGIVTGLVHQREVAGFTQSEVAQKMHTTQSSVARLESGERDPRLSTLISYADSIGVNFFDLLLGVKI